MIKRRTTSPKSDKECTYVSADEQQKPRLVRSRRSLSELRAEAERFEQEVNMSKTNGRKARVYRGFHGRGSVSHPRSEQSRNSSEVARGRWTLQEEADLASVGIELSSEESEEM